MRDPGPEIQSETERRLLEPYFTDPSGSVFALTNLPEVVKGALFARYSRSAKGLKRLFLDEFAKDAGGGAARTDAGLERAQKLYSKVFVQYGDDSVAQLGGVHLACEGVSNILTKVLERGRLMAYLEQSTRYVPFTDKPGGRFKYVVPLEVEGVPAIAARFTETVDAAFTTYTALLERMKEHFREKYPKKEGEKQGVHERAVRARALDAVRGLLPAATSSNVGIYGTGQAYEMLLMRMRAHPLAEVRHTADRMLVELRKVIPAFLARVDVEDRGGAWIRYFARTRAAIDEAAAEVLGDVEVPERPEVALTDFDPQGEANVAAAALYEATDLPDDLLAEKAGALSGAEVGRILTAYVGNRTNRRHRPGRAFERTSYRFDVLSDYGAFRDLQRHRMLTIEWQRLTTDHGYRVPEEIEEAGAAPDFVRVMDNGRALHDELRDSISADVASYAVPMAFRIRYVMEMNAREAMHVIELRTTPQGHPAYRRVCREMHRLIREEAGHRRIADAMTFVGGGEVQLGRLEAERRTERRRSS